MFTGIVTHTTPVEGSKYVGDGLTITFKRPRGWTDMELGESIATDGVCLTVSEINHDSYECHLMPETLAKTTFGVNVPKSVNLERSLTAKDRFGGHFVQGHVDGMGEVVGISRLDGYEVRVSFDPKNEELIAYKGSICVNGVSLTIAAAEGNTFSVALIPHTLEHTTLSSLRLGDKVNLEFDMIAKHIAIILDKRAQKNIKTK